MSSSPSPIKTFKGYAISDTKKWHDFELIEFEPKKLEDRYVEIALHATGVCGSDIHTITGGWGELSVTPLIVGHEACGVVTQVGKGITDPGIKVGARVGVGAQIWSCLECKACKSDNENYCPKQVDTYNAKYPNGEIAHGCYSNGIRAHEQFVFPIPDELDDDLSVAPMFCGGLTVFGPLYRHGAGPGKKVGVVGLGGLGHYAVMFAKALGAEVTVFSHTDSKKEDALKLGAVDFVATESEKDFAEKREQTYDLIVCTADVSSAVQLTDYVPMLVVNGKIIVAGLPDDELPAFQAQALTSNGAMIVGTHVGSKKEVTEMLKIAAKHNIKTWNNVLPLSKASEAVQGLKKGENRYRYVLQMDITE